MDAAGPINPALLQRLRDEAQDGRLRFDRYWEGVMYTPGLGYYSAGARKFGAEGDFVTAPELGPIFGRLLARQLRELLAPLHAPRLMELGAGTGALAATVLSTLNDLDCLPEIYWIVERSADLRERQEQRLAELPPELSARVRWLDALPESPWEGVVFGNEVVDALAPRRFEYDGQRWWELYVDVRRKALRWAREPAPESLTPTLAQIEAHWDGAPTLPYRTEVQVGLAEWLGAIGEHLRQGALLLVDYGYSGSEYYQAERNDGTLICHARHRAHADPFRAPGQEDLSVSVDFSRLAEAADQAGFTPAGYATQAHFLMSLGLDEVLAELADLDTAEQLSRAAEVKRLTLPGEMGERFKVFYATRGLPREIRGFAWRNLLARL